MNILMLGWELPPHNSGGLGEACMGLTRALTNQGVHITFVLPKKVDIDASHMDVVFANITDEGSSLYPAYTTNASYRKSNIRIDDFPPDFVRGAYAFADKIEGIVKKYKSDLVHSHDWMTFPAGVHAQSLSGKPLVTHIHSTEFDRTGGNFPNKYVYDIEKKGVQQSDRVISVSGLTKSIVSREYGVDLGKIDVVYNGVENFERQRLPYTLESLKQMGYKIVLFLGRITLQKGPEYFVRAAKRISEFEPKTVFVVVGSGDMQGQMMEEVANNGIMDRFFFTGFLRGREKDQIYQSSDVYVMPSVSEPFGITALEAVSHGTCVLASKQSGVSEVLTNILKVDFWDTEEMANKIISLFRYPAMEIDLQKNSKEELKNINWDRAAEKTIQVYKQLI
jgi:glycogen(starch) synthase